MRSLLREGYYGALNTDTLLHPDGCSKIGQTAGRQALQAGTSARSWFYNGDDARGVEAFDRKCRYTDPDKGTELACRLGGDTLHQYGGASVSPLAIEELDTGASGTGWAPFRSLTPVALVLTSSWVAASFSVAGPCHVCSTGRRERDELRTRPGVAGRGCALYPYTSMCVSAT